MCNIYARVVDVSEIERVRFLMQKERARIYVQSTFHVVFVYYIHTESFILLPAFSCISNLLQNDKDNEVYK